MINPLRRFIKQRKLSVDDLALLAGVHPSRLYLVLNGVPKLPDRLLKVVEQSGESVEQFVRDYEEYQENRREELSAKLTPATAAR